MAVRNNIQDFMRDVRARSVAGGNQYAASINADNVTVSISKNGVVTWSKVFYNVQGSAANTDAAGTGNYDTVTIIDGSGNPRVGGCQDFINQLT